ncbi:MAG: hypothetical protein JWO31_1203, partial [Phycisphaerales bacterium]|nr:hypothetical protein [Phycisphaerales bacterium]
LGAAEPGSRCRARALLDTLASAVRRYAAAGPPADRLAFEAVLPFPPTVASAFLLTAVIGPGDAREPVLTILLPDED